PSDSGAVKGEGKRLVVGRSIKLTGDIDVCESLIVEGHLEANLTDARVVDVVSGGMFKGSAEVEEAHITGTFDGTLSTRRHLAIYAGAVVKGKVRYEGDLTVEPGAIIKADIKYTG